MKKYFGVGMLCLTLMASGTALAGNTHKGFNNKTYNLDYNVDSSDLKNGNDDKNHDDNKGDKGDKGDKGNKDKGCDTLKLPTTCPSDKGSDNQNAGCDFGDKGGKDCHKDHGGCTNPPIDPSVTPVVPLPASSVMGGVGLALVGFMGWARSRRAIVA